MVRRRRRPTRFLALLIAVGSIGLTGLGPAAAERSPDPSRRPVGTRRATAAQPGLATVAGSGFGHGVGLSQYGALGMARAGYSASAIVGHYFTGVTVRAVRDATDIRVNVVHRGRSVDLRPIAIGGASDVRLRLTPATGSPLLLGPSDTATLTPSGRSLRVVVRRGSGGAVQRAAAGWTAEWSGTAALRGPASRVALSSAIIGSSGRKVRSYRWGRLSLSPLDGAVEAVTTVDLHSGYLRGLAEMPSSWPPAALQAQVITARSYALVEAATAPRASCGGCQVWDDQRSQVYVGWAKEGERIAKTAYGARWVAAVSATSPSSTTGIAVVHQGRPVQTYYASSTGGRTRDPKAVWGTAVPYLRSVPDPWSVDPAVNPLYAAWRRTVSVGSLVSAFGITDGSGLASIRVTAKDGAGAATVLTARSGAGAVRTLSGGQFRSRFGLPSAWITGITLPAT